MKLARRVFTLGFFLLFIWGFTMVWIKFDGRWLLDNCREAESSLDAVRAWEDSLGSNKTVGEQQGQQQTYQEHRLAIKELWPPKAGPADYGYGGTGVTINVSQLSKTDEEKYNTGLDTFQANQYVSERIPLRREIFVDMPECRKLPCYNATDLPTAGVVLILYNEMWSSLLRTVFSILDAGPEELITEIVLVDDASTREYLGKPLEDYLRIFDGKVKLVRLPSRQGLIAARNMGFEHVTGEVAVFLDSHVEVHKGWLEPLLHRIRQDDNIIAVPHTDVLKWDTFEYVAKENERVMNCGFEFSMRYIWLYPAKIDGYYRKTLTDPIRSPTHMGCCLAVSKRNFQRLGKYDPGLRIWGCENLELSFKAWMCGSGIEIIPCSHIGHMYRPFFPYKFDDGHAETKNCIRVASVWMDEYKHLFLDRLAYEKLDYGDISEQKALREKLQCKSFDWYVKQVYPDLFLPINTTASGKIISAKDPSLCIEKALSGKNNQDHPARITKCRSMETHQYFVLTTKKQIRRDSGCLIYDSTRNLPVARSSCHDKSRWEYTQNNQIKLYGSDQCIALSKSMSEIVMKTCDEGDLYQQWNWPRKSLL